MKNINKMLAVGSACMLMCTTAANSVYAETVTADSTNGSYASTTGGENAVLANGSTVSLTNPTVTKSGDSNSENADFNGTNAAVLAENGASLTITGGTVNSSASHANGVFSYGSGTTVTITGTQITTTGNNSGGIMTTGGATMNASDLTVTTSGNSSAAIRSDRGGGDVNVSGGTYTSNGVGSPAIYSTADIDVINAVLSATKSEGVVIEGKNSVSLTNTNVTANNATLNGQSTVKTAVFIYQSMSGDAETGKASFDMTSGTLVVQTGDVFHVTNTTADITLNNTAITYADGYLLNIAADSWGTSGSNGGNVNFVATDQSLSGNILVDSISALNYYLKGTSSYTGAINTGGDTGSVYVEIESDAKWTLTADSYVDGLTCDADAIDLNGHTLYVNGTAYTSGTASTGTAVTFSTSSSSSNTQPGGTSGGQSGPDANSGATSSNSSSTQPGGQSGPGGNSNSSAQPGGQPGSDTNSGATNGGQGQSGNRPEENKKMPSEDTCTKKDEVYMYRLYNANSGEHFYTSNADEADYLVTVGWTYEGVGWTAPVSGDPVYRLYNANSGEHHYTMSTDECSMLVDAGWTLEGIGWYSDTAKTVPLYRQYNPNEYSCNHNYTTSKEENDNLVSLGWNYEGISWYAAE